MHYLGVHYLKINSVDKFQGMLQKILVSALLSSLDKVFLELKTGGKLLWQ
jgi:hypothetical protein